MYIRWTHRRSTAVDWVTRLRAGARGRAGNNPGDVSHYAYLVQSTRIDGKPRQRLVAYIGSIVDSQGGTRRTTRCLSNPADRYWFWRDAGAKLDAAGLADAARARCEAALASVVPPLAGDDLAAYEAQLAAFAADHRSSSDAS